MRLRRPGVVATWSLLTGAGLLALSTRRSGVLAIASAGYGQLFLNLAVLDYVSARNGAAPLSTRASRHLARTSRELSARLRASLRQGLRRRQDVIWLSVAIGIGIVVRTYSLTQPMRYDESYTFLYFVRKGFPGLFFYPSPNNHVLHTIFVRWSTLLLGSYPASIRLPAFLAGVATIPLTFCLCRTLRAGRSGYFAAIAIAVLPYMVLYSTMARGYSLLVVSTLALAWIGLHVIDDPTWGGCAVLAFIGALGMLTMPSMLFALAGVYLWLGTLLLIEQRSVRAAVGGFVIPCGTMTLLLSVLFYTPSIIESGGVQSIVANPFVQPLPWATFVAGAAPHLRTVASELAWDVPTWMRAVCVLLVCAGMLGAAYERNWAMMLLAPAVAIGSAALFLLKQSIPFVRTWIYLIPFVLIVADAGLTYATKRVPRRLQMLLPLLLITFGTYRAVSMISRDVIASSAGFPEAPEMVEQLKRVMRSGDVVQARIPADVPMQFYMWYYGLPESSSAQGADHPNRFFIVDTRSYALTDMTHEPVAVVAEYGKSVLYRSLAPDPGNVAATERR